MNFNLHIPLYLLCIGFLKPEGPDREVRDTPNRGRTKAGG